MAGNWTKLTVNTSTENLEIASSVVSMLDNGLMIEDYSDFSLNGMYGELVDEEILNADTSKVKISIFVPEEKPLSEYVSFLRERFLALGIENEITTEGLCEDDWAEAWKQYYKPIPLGKVTIVPAWEKYDASEGEVTLKMDPGMAFGTGTHETTRLCLLLLQDEIRGGERVLDVGTGSGILSIAASKLGARSANAYDIDPVAVKVARENVRDNECEGVSVDVSDLLRGVDLSHGKYNFCVANIVADIILRMLPDIRTYLEDGAPLILSGIIAPRADDVRDGLRAIGYQVEREITENDWVAMLARAK